MATRRPTDPPRKSEPPKEIPKVIKADQGSAPVRKPTAAPAGTPTPAPSAAATPARQRKVPVPAPVSEDVRRSMIAEAAYLRAERRGFAPGHDREDWVAAELEVDALLKARHGGTSQ